MTPYRPLKLFGSDSNELRLMNGAEKVRARINIAAAIRN